jgi:hypothetical protein
VSDYANGIGPSKNMVIPGRQWLGTPTALVANAKT